MKVAIYTRVSTEDQVREGTSLQVQREFLESCAKREGWAVYSPAQGKIYEDDGYSGNLRDRPALNKLFHDARNHKFDIVLVYKIDRFARNNRMLLNLVAELSEFGIGLKSATESFDTVTAAGKMALSMLGTVAQFERDRIIERVFPGMIKGVERGNWQGARYAPYGYYYNKEKKLLEVVKIEADIVKLIYTMYLSGQTTTRTAGYLYNKGYKTRSGGRFNTKLICDILKNQIYLGKLVWNKHHYDKSQKTLKGLKYVKNDPSKVIISQGRHESIICQEDFDDVQKKLALARRGVVVRNGTKEYPLTGILYCARCGNRFMGCNNTASRVDGKTATKRRYYRCGARQTYNIKCDNSYVRSNDIEAAVYKILEVIFMDGIDQVRIDSLIQVGQESYSEDIEQELKKINSELDANLKKQERLSGIYSEGLLAIEAFKKQILPLREQEADIRARIKKVELSLVQRERSREYLRILKAVAGHFDAIDEKMDLAGKKGLLKLIFKSIQIDKGKIKKLELYEPFKSLYEGAMLKWEVKRSQWVATKRDCVSTSLPTDAR